MHVQPYLSFEGRCEEAANFYCKALGAEIKGLLRFKDAPASVQQGMASPGSEEKVMHMSLRIGDSTLMASDGQCQGSASFQGISLSLTPANEADAKRYFNALADGGQVQVPLGQTFFSPCFGMVQDRFGVSWMVYIPGQS
ncbi:MAG TPA: VOC family protein [Isosphaeraceae bacterium]|jgi:PhnB protein|nr:VOC family protein [Isosphaeraceae bacterium]